MSKFKFKLGDEVRVIATRKEMHNKNFYYGEHGKGHVGKITSLGRHEESYALDGGRVGDYIHETQLELVTEVKEPKSKLSQLVKVVNKYISGANLARVVEGDLSHIGDALVEGKTILFKGECIDSISFDDTAEKYSIKPEPELTTEAKVLQWHEDRNLIDGSNDLVQFVKLVEELGELAGNILRKKPIQDDLGDMLVVLHNIAARNKTTLNECLEVAYEDIKDRSGRMTPEGNFIKEEDL